MNDKNLNIKISSDLYKQLQDEAKKLGISMAGLVRMICNGYFANK